MSSLSQLWEKVKADEKLAKWPDGIAFEYLILRAFEISGAKITYPYSVELFGIKKVEQIDGMISIEDKNLFVITESKDWDRNTPVAPVTKMRNQLMRRPNSLIGSIFTATSFTESAVLLSHFLSPQTILLWNSEDIDYCFKNAYFLQGMDSKYQYAMKEGKPDFDLASNDPFKDEAPV